MLDPGIAERFWEKVAQVGDCWQWTAARTGGYGVFNIGAGVTRRAHRLAYEEMIGEIPEGLDLDHLCRNRACVNPNHLEPVTRRVNLLRGKTIVAREATKTHCVAGHEFNNANTYVTSTGWRKCRPCDRRRQRDFRARKGAAT
ncbi:HNH endonuclease signature motif containing protein [Saccharopolyspora shandongensis]|uniref:HNH endonuclease signature motif containing protein n=1 Tax=Saccharopolyspora shandongensis TaxID=418495 RepID=UPI001C431551